MNSKAVTLGAIVGLALAGCRQQAEQNGAANTVGPSPAANAESANALANAAAPAPEPAASSSAAAGAVLKDYARLASRREFAAAARLWTDPSAAAQFAADLDDYPKIAMSVGTPGEPEGAAGSSFVSIPVTLALTLRSGAPYDMRCKAVLRRVNDVPGASARQLRWNIQSIDC